MKIFRNLGDRPPQVDAARLRESMERVARFDAELDLKLSALAVDQPGNAVAVAAAGVACRAAISRYASMLELGGAAVDALRRAGWSLTPPPAAPREKTHDDAAQTEKDIPDDWVT